MNQKRQKAIKKHALTKETDVSRPRSSMSSNRSSKSNESTRFSVSTESDEAKQVSLFKEPTDERSEYFSMIGEIGTSSQAHIPRMDLKLEDVEEIRKIFEIFDQDGNGSITTNELRNIVGSLGQSTTEAEVMDMVNSIDSDGNGIIEFPEFLAMVNGKLPTAKRPNQLEMVFKVFDVDGSREINAENLRRMFGIFGQELDESDISEMLVEADYDGDGKVGFEDFVKMMNS